MKAITKWFISFWTAIFVHLVLAGITLWMAYGQENRVLVFFLAWAIINMVCNTFILTDYFRYRFFPFIPNKEIKMKPICQCWEYKKSDDYYVVKDEVESQRVIWLYYQRACQFCGTRSVYDSLKNKE
jgi:hypothetical protein